MFSAVLGAFTIESYRQLQQNPVDVSVQILAQISFQLASLSPLGNVSAIVAPNQLPPFTPSTSAVRINALWFASLLCSLLTASLSMFVKQWLREYLALGCTSSEERIRTRHFRYQGLLQWKVFELAAVLPFLLQIALLLFLVGLSEFLKPLDHTVWLSTTTLIIAWLCLYVASLLVPALSKNCPYKTPFLNPGLGVIRGLFAQLWHCDAWRVKTQCFNSYYNYPGDERGIRRDITYDISALIFADKVLADDRILANVLQPCIQRAQGEGVVWITRELLSHRLREPIPALFEPIGFERIPTRALSVVIKILTDTIEQEMLRPEPQWTLWMMEAAAGLSSALNHAHLRGRDVELHRPVNVISSMFSLDLAAVKELLRILSTDSPLVAWNLSGDHGISSSK